MSFLTLTISGTPAAIEDLKQRLCEMTGLTATEHHWEPGLPVEKGLWRIRDRQTGEDLAIVQVHFADHGQDAQTIALVDDWLTRCRGDIEHQELVLP